MRAQFGRLVIAPSGSSSSLPAARLSLGAAALAGLVGLGCNLQGQARNPTFTAATAPEPTVMIAPVSCRSQHRGQAGDAFQNQFRLLVRTLVKTPQVTLDPEQHSVLCSAFGKTYGDATFVIGGGDGTDDWKAGVTVSAVIQEIAKNYNAKSVFLPLSAHNTNCSRDESIVKDSKGQQVASVDHGTTTCSEGGTVVLRAYLFSSEGTVYWKSWSRAAGDSPEGAERGVTALLSGIPAKFGDDVAVRGGDAASAGGASPETAPEPLNVSPAADRGDGRFNADDIVESQLGKNSPRECRQLVRQMCDRVAELPADTRVQICTSYASSYRAMASLRNAADMCRRYLAAMPKPKT